MELWLGVRVIRGIDWVYKNQDGGHGHVGTVIENGDSCQPKRPQRAVMVQWDSGNKGLYRAGHEKAFDLRIYAHCSSADQSSHFKVWCDGCGVSEIRGVRWRCTECYAIDLCTDCYMDDRHDVTHVFMRVQSSEKSSMGPKLPARVSAPRTTISGIFPGARVYKYPAWVQRKPYVLDMGEDTDVTLEGRVGHGRKLSQVAVDFGDGVASYCHVGLCCTLPGINGRTYHTHLPHLGDDQVLEIGDKVAVVVSGEDLEKLQRRHGLWEPRIANEVGSEGTIVGKGQRGDLDVIFTKSKERCTINPVVVKKLHTLCTGMTVRISVEMEMVQRNQTEHGVWTSEMTKANGKLGRVVMIEGADVHVKLDDSRLFIFNAASITPEKRSVLPNVDPMLNDFFQVYMTVNMHPDSAIVKAVSARNLPLISRILDEKPHLVNYEPVPHWILLGFTVANCDLDVVKLLVERGAFIEAVDRNGCTPLVIACTINKIEHVRYLLEKGADVNAVPREGGSCLQIATSKGHVQCAHYLLKHGADINLKDKTGKTPLHFLLTSESEADLPRQFAPLSGKRATFDMVTERKDLDFKAVDELSLSAFQLAARINDIHYIKKIMEKAPRIREVRTSSGKTPLMIAAQFNAAKSAAFLINQTRCDLNESDADEGNTALSYALDEPSFGVVEVLMKNGASCNIPDKVGKTSLQQALEIRHANLFSRTRDKYRFLTEIIDKWGSLGIKTTSDAIVAYLVSNGGDLDTIGADKITIRRALSVAGDQILPALEAIEKQRRPVELQRTPSTPTRAAKQLGGDVAERRHLTTRQLEIQDLKSRLEEKKTEVAALTERLKSMSHVLKKARFACGNDVVRSFADLIPRCPHCSEPIADVLDLENA